LLSFPLHRRERRLSLLQRGAPRRDAGVTRLRHRRQPHHALLNRAAIKAQYRSANARQIQAVYNYERTLLQAFTDVANQLAMIDNLKRSYELQSRQVSTLSRSVEISNILFQSARADYMEVLLT